MKRNLNLFLGILETHFQRARRGCSATNVPPSFMPKAAWWLAGNTLGVGMRAGVPVLAGLRGAGGGVPPLQEGEGPHSSNEAGSGFLLVRLCMGVDRGCKRLGVWALGVYGIATLLWLASPCHDSYDCEALLAFELVLGVSFKHVMSKAVSNPVSRTSSSGVIYHYVDPQTSPFALGAASSFGPRPG